MMSNKKEEKSPKRAYTLRVLARRRDAVHSRITKAAVYLHGTVGPAHTTMNDIARRAGVRRATVYNHFPTDKDLFEACSSHWLGQNPPPDVTSWAEIGDAGRRVEVSLEALYAYYDHGQAMLENFLRDTPQVPALKEIIRQKWWPMLEGIARILVKGWNSGEVDSSDTETTDTTVAEDSEVRSVRQTGDLELIASIRVALDFFTWQTLTASGLTNIEASRLMAAWIKAIGKPEK